MCICGLSPFTKSPRRQGGQWKDSSEGATPGPLLKSGCGGEALRVPTRQSYKTTENTGKIEPCRGLIGTTDYAERANGEK